MSIFQTSRDTNRIFYLYPFMGSLDEFNFETRQNGFEMVEIKYSFSHDKSTWSGWFNTTQELVDGITTDINDINTYIRVSIVTKKSRNLDFCSFEIMAISVNGVPIGIENVEQGNNNNIIVNAKSGDRFDPYRNYTKQQELFARMSKSISDIFSFECVYFKVTADIGTQSVTFKSYRLKNVVDQKPLPIVIKDNHLPGNRYVYSELDIDFQDEIEIHIIKEVFRETFGEEFEPDTNDFLYLPLTDRMYEVNTSSQGALFMNDSPYWKAFLIKYENRDNVVKPEGIFDDLPTEIDTLDQFEEELAAEEKNDASKPFDNINFDGSDDFITADSPRVDGIDYSYAYPTAEEFSRSYGIDRVENTVSMAFWFKFVADRQLLVFTDSDGVTVRITTTKDGVRLNIGIFDLSVSDLLIEGNKWLGLVVNISKEMNFASISVYDEYGNLLVENSDSTMDIPDNYIHSIVINSGFVWTNFRSFKKVLKPSESFALLSDPLPNYENSLVLDNPTPNLQ